MIMMHSMKDLARWFLITPMGSLYSSVICVSVITRLYLELTWVCFCLSPEDVYKDYSQLSTDI